MINVTKSFMPPIEEYEDYLKKIWESRYLTNEGMLLQELMSKMHNYLNIENINLVTNGTIALQLAVKALDLAGTEIITTPFSFVATMSSIMWEKCTPVFVDINRDTLCIDTNQIEKAITPKTKAILAVHVYGYPCDVENIDKIAKKHNLKVIYDGAHAFGCFYKGKSLLSYGDVTTCSFHATKVFHTIEGGACFSSNKKIDEKIQELKTFGSVNGVYKDIGINAKMTEFNAAMGLANIKYINAIIEKRKKISQLYDELLKGRVERPKKIEDLQYNYIYYPIILKDEQETLSVIQKLKDKDINARRYFYPSLNTLEFVQNKQKCPISEDISKRILCLPLYPDLKESEVIEICNTIKS